MAERQAQDHASRQENDEPEKNEGGHSRSSETKNTSSHGSVRVKETGKALLAANESTSRRWCLVLTCNTLN
jgi:hypothetical protein